MAQDSVDYEEKVMTRSDILAECREMMRRFRVFERHPSHAAVGGPDFAPALQQSQTVPYPGNALPKANSVQPTAQHAKARGMSVNPNRHIRIQDNLRGDDPAADAGEDPQPRQSRPVGGGYCVSEVAIAVDCRCRSRGGGW